MTHLKEGDKAPGFTGTDQNGHKISLDDFKGQKVALYFYPEDDTPGCTTQACNLRDHYPLLQQQGFVVLGVSPNNAESHQAFREKYSLPFALLADLDHQIIDLYGVWGDKQMYGRTYQGLQRTTFLIDATGMIRKIFLKPRNKQHAEDILKTSV